MHPHSCIGKGPLTGTSLFLYVVRMRLSLAAQEPLPLALSSTPICSPRVCPGLGAIDPGRPVYADKTPHPACDVNDPAPMQLPMGKMPFDHVASQVALTEKATTLRWAGSQPGLSRKLGSQKKY